MSLENGCLKTKRGSIGRMIRYVESILYVYVKEKMALVQSKRSAAYIYFILAPRIIKFGISGNHSGIIF